MPECTVTNGPVDSTVAPRPLYQEGVSTSEEEKLQVKGVIEVGRVGLEPTTDGL
jgi:hypothetical protein